ncbi:L-threonine O-3-phosphate decarboxylase [Thalassococcus halodurans]|uniref:threonine-phosphate decarboxylase n=1 Tax=Thalassococcus halodurans TaxID=373675 RepID=A0A1H6A1S9_9RHOB|nr:threonine-phosphate decarboxylase CobD [Thalassococcus halodurans]SEG42689.1 L-threonine O-3-phosphate decarboxylase [Thalassococcus halodurans]
MTQSRDHGGNLDAAMARFGGTSNDWLDLSTGINPMPYPLPPIPQTSWEVLPRKTEMARLSNVAAKAYNTPARVIATSGAQGAIQIVPWLRAPGRAAVLAPTYNEHAAALRACGWQVDEVSKLDALAGADLAVVVNPNNPDGRRTTPDRLQALSQQVGLLIIDESFGDPEPDLSLAPQLEQDNVVILRSFGKFYGLAGVRLGFALAQGSLADRLADMVGPWPVSGPAIDIACQALADTNWQEQTIDWLAASSDRLDGMAQKAGWEVVGGTPLFRTYATPDATAAQNALAAHHVWSRIFPYSNSWIRLGLPKDDRWSQLEAAMEAATCK